MANVYAVLLAGGKGTRLWPLSAHGHLKSFISIGKKRTLIEDTIERLKGLVDRKNIVIVTDKAQRNSLLSFVKGVPRNNILVEPFGRSTASAIGLAAIKLEPDDVIVAIPTDALVERPVSFRACIKEAVEFVKSKSDTLISVGCVPKGPSTAYGYIKLGKRQTKNVYVVQKFIEKPSLKVARSLIKDSRYLWNAGIFIFKTRALLSAIKKYAPGLYKALGMIKKDKTKIKAAYSGMKNVSIDYQIMEKAKNLYCVRGDFAWCDLGNWNSVAGLLVKDARGNACFGNANLLDTRDSVVYNTGKNKLAVAGITNAIIVSTKNGILVASRKYAEKVKELVSRFEAGKW